MTKLLCSALHLSATVLRLEAIHRFIRSGKLPTPSFFPVNTAAPLYMKSLHTGNYLHDSSWLTLDPTSYKSDDLRFHPSSSSQSSTFVHTHHTTIIQRHTTTLFSILFDTSFDHQLQQATAIGSDRRLGHYRDHRLKPILEQRYKDTSSFFIRSSLHVLTPHIHTEHPSQHHLYTASCSRVPGAHHFARSEV